MNSNGRRFAGVLDRLKIDRGQPDKPAEYRLRLEQNPDIPLNAQIGKGLAITFDGNIVCRYCQKVGRRSFAGGYCYDCFKTLARCDLCVMSPDRCHYHLGTCREPEWGDSFCMHPHLVYLANTSGTKVGITRKGFELGRWLDQGAIQAVAILEVSTRRAAGLAEVEIGRLLPDRTEWRKMVRRDVPELDLLATLDYLRQADLQLATECKWLNPTEVERFQYPFSDVQGRVESLKLAPGTIEGDLVGIKGQYLLLTSGALNIRQHAGYQVQVTFHEQALDLGSKEGTQLGLF
jgi:hypothetical protein